MKYYKLFALTALLSLGACSQEEGPINSGKNTPTTTDNREKVSLSLDLSGEARMLFADEDKARGITYEVKDDTKGANIAPLTAQKLYSIVVISNEKGDETHTFSLVWNKSDKKNHYYVKEIKKNDIAGQEVPKLDLNEKWFISGVLTPNEKSIDVANRKIHFTPNTNIGPVNNSATTNRAGGSEQIEKDIPLYFEWTELWVPTKNGGTDAISTKESSAKLSTESIKIKPMGTLMRIKLRNDNTYPVRVKSLRVFSSVMATSEGSIDLSKYNKTHKPEQIKYVPDHVGEDDKYNLPNLDLAEDESYPHDFLIWGVPVTPKTAGGSTYFTGRPFSQLILDVKRLDNQGLEQDKPKMDALYVWGSETNNPKQATRLRINAKILRPMGLLEYYSEGYWTGNKTGELFTIDANKAVYKSGQQLYDMLTNNSSELPDGYRPMQYNDARLLFPTWTGAAALNITSLNDIPNPIGGEATVRFPGETIDITAKDTIQIKNRILYALRFDDGKGAGKRKHLSAWKYNYDDATIEMVYLGSTFKGVFTDILKEEFWTNHQDDIVKNTYAPGTTKFLYERTMMPIDWYYEKDAEYQYGVTSDILLSTLAEIYPPSGTGNKGTGDKGSEDKSATAFGISALGLVRKNITWAPGAFRRGKASLVVKAQKKDPSQEFPQGITEKTTTKAIRINTVVLVKKTADY